MVSLFLFETVIVAIATFSSYLTWGPLTSREMVFWFSPQHKIITKMEASDVTIERLRKSGMKAEISRTIVLYFISVLAFSFYSPDVYFSRVHSHTYFRWGIIIGIVISIYWNFYYGPLQLAIRDCGYYKFFSKEHFIKYSRPYWVWSLYPICMFVVLGLYTILVLVMNIANDIAYQENIVHELNSIANVNFQDLQLRVIQLNQFGYWISSVSQKYILTTLLFFAFLLFEQRSILHTTILDSSVERLKIAGWILLFFAVGYSLVFLPIEYTKIHSKMLLEIETVASIPSNLENLGDILSSQGALQDHNLQWLIVYTLTGYGNLVSYAVIMVSFFTWKVYFSKYPIQVVIKLLVPKIILTGMKKIFGDVYLELDLNKDI